jgi:hypothetical protein
VRSELPEDLGPSVEDAMPSPAMLDFLDLCIYTSPGSCVTLPRPALESHITSNEKNKRMPPRTK